MPKRTSYPTPQDAEAAFYEALEKGDLEGMMEVWAEDEEIICVHPGGPRLTGYEQVRESWTRIFASQQRLQVHLSHQVAMQGMMLSVHSLHENILVVDENRTHPVVVTNVYVRTGDGWRMVAHHASPAPQAPAARSSDGPKVLH